MLPPKMPGGRVRNSPSSAGATPMTPQNGRKGTTAGVRDRLISPSSSQRKRNGWENRCLRNPRPSTTLVQPQPLWATSRTSICSTSPGSAPFTKTGPVRAWIRPRSIARYSGNVMPGRTWAPLESTHSKCTVSPESIVRRGGSARSQREWVGSFDSLCSVMALLDFYCHLQLNQRVARQASHANGRSYMAARISKELDEEVGGAIDHSGGVGKTGRGIDVTADADKTLDRVERTEVAPQDS